MGIAGFLQELQRDFALELEVLGKVDRPHAADTERGQDAIM